MEVRSTHPLLTHMTVMSTLIMFAVSEPFRVRVQAVGDRNIKMPSVPELLLHVDELLKRTLAP